MFFLDKALLSTSALINMATTTFEGFGTAAIHVGQEPEKWDMHQVGFYIFVDQVRK
jgi:hypothetical protein